MTQNAIRRLPSSAHPLFRKCRSRVSEPRGFTDAPWHRHLEHQPLAQLALMWAASSIGHHLSISAFCKARSAAGDN